MTATSCSPSKLGHLYHRVSSTAQLVGDGLDRQLEGTQRYVEREGLEIVQTYVDRGISAYRGKNRRVGELALILRHIESGVIRSGEHLVIESIDRLSRQPPLDALETLKAILARGVIVHSVFDNRAFSLDSINADVGSLLALVVSMARANEESKVKSQRVADAHRRGRESGKIIAGSIPSWLAIEKDGNGNKRFKIKEYEAGVVRDMFEMSAQGISSYRIAQQLKEAGHRPFGSPKKRIGSKTAGEHHWNATSILDILRGKSVLGEFRSYTTSYDAEGKRVLTLASVNANYYVPIIDADLWTRANRALASRKKERIRGRTGETFANVLRDVVVCAHCQRAMHFKVQYESGTKARYIRLRCSGRSENVCDNTTMPRYQALELATLALVSEVELTDRRTEEAMVLDRLIAADTLKIETLDGEVRQMVNLMLKGAAGSDAVSQMIAEKEAEKIALKKAITDHQQKRDVVASRQSPKDRRIAVNDLRSRMAAATGTELYAIRSSLNLRIREAVDRMEFDKGGRVTVHLHGTEDRYFFTKITREGLLVDGIVDGSLACIGVVHRGQVVDAQTMRMERNAHVFKTNPRSFQHASPRFLARLARYVAAIDDKDLPTGG